MQEEDPRIKQFWSIEQAENAAEVPYFNIGIKAGFPNPAINYKAESLDLNKYLVSSPATTFCATVDGDSLADAGVDDGDIIIIDKSLEPKDGDLAVCYIDGGFTLKYIKVEKDVVMLIPANQKYTPIQITKDNEFLIWGIVTYSIKKHKKRKL